MLHCLPQQSMGFKNRYKCLVCVSTSS
uniref:Uncharacterized protein n=1 Tax=Arundo donax TaxID=35708 RepID=A0A0A9DFX8_ARUDO